MANTSLVLLPHIAAIDGLHLKIAPQASINGWLDDHDDSINCFDSSRVYFSGQRGHEQQVLDNCSRYRRRGSRSISRESRLYPDRSWIRCCGVLAFHVRYTESFNPKSGYPEGEARLKKR